MTAAGGSVAIGIRLENWSSYTLTQVGHIYIYTHTGCSQFTLNVSSLFLTTQPEFVPNYGSTSAKLPVVSVGPGAVELAVLKQEQVCSKNRGNMFNLFFFQAATGVSGILRWRIGTSDTILSLMVSVPYRYLCMAMAICGNGNAVNKIYFQPAPLFFLGCCGTHQRQPGSRLLCHVLRNSRQVAEMFNIHNKLLYI